MKTSLGTLNPVMQQQVQRGRLAEVARALVDDARERNDPAVADAAKAVADVLGELQVLAQQYAKNDKAQSAAKTSGVAESGIGTVGAHHNQRTVRTSPLSSRFAPKVQAAGVTLPSVEVATVLLAQIYSADHVS